MHHVTYARRFDEPIEHLLAVCSPCHRALSDKADFPFAAEEGQSATLESIERKVDALLLMHTEAGSRVP